MDCQFRHCEEDKQGVVIGMQMMGLTETPGGLRHTGAHRGDYEEFCPCAAGARGQLGGLVVV